jgi:hypothetical protein
VHLHHASARHSQHSTESSIGATMRFLYGSKKNVPRRLVGTFSSEAQLLAYVRWATLQSTGERSGKFEQGSVLASYNSWEASPEPLTDDDPSAVEHNPTPSML